MSDTIESLDVEGKLVVTCVRCSHGHTSHSYKGKHECLIEECPCAYFSSTVSFDGFGSDVGEIDDGTRPEPQEVEYDAVKIPSHYNSGRIEVANFIADQELDYNHGNVVKYVCRAGKKNPEKELEDLEKAAAYLQMVYNVAQGLPAVVRDPETKEVVWTLFRN